MAPACILDCASGLLRNIALQGWGSDRNSFPPDVRNAYIEQLRDLPTVHAICEEYRAAVTLDFAQDTEVHNVKRRIACSLLALRGKVH
jgi:haloacetate dehalogenase